MFLPPTKANVRSAELIISAVARAYNITFKQVRGVYVRVDGTCTAYDEELKRCKIYKNRADRCRKFYCGRYTDGEKRKEKKSGEER